LTTYEQILMFLIRLPIVRHLAIHLWMSRALKKARAELSTYLTAPK
jgi:hypothetical protein